MITGKSLDRATAEATRFLQLAYAARLIFDGKTGTYAQDLPLVTGRKETAAVRRASMDLTRALADLRRH